MALKYAFVAFIVVFLGLSGRLVPAAEHQLYPSKINFQHLLQNKDIVLGEVREIFQDSQGFIWIGGWNALVRYDGYEFKPIELDVSQDGGAEAEPVSGVVQIIEAANKKLWFAGLQGVYLYDLRLAKLMKVPSRNSSAEALENRQFSRVHELPDQRILATSNSGIFIIDPVTFEYRYWGASETENADENRLGQASVKAVYQFEDNYVWFGHHAGLDKFNLRAETFEHYYLDPEKLEAGTNLVQDIVGAEDGKLWVATNRHIVKFDPLTGHVKRYPLGRGGGYGLGNGEVWDLLLDSRGRLWAAHDQGGVSLYVAPEDRFINYLPNSALPNSIASDKVRTIFEDDNGDLWFGFYPEGIDFFDQSTTAITTYTNDVSDANSLSHNSVTSISEDADGNLWLGTDGGGLNFFDRKKNQFSVYIRENENTESLGSNAVLTTFIDSRGYVWVGTWGAGVNRFDPRTKKFKRYSYSFDPQSALSSKRLNSGHAWGIMEANDGTLWFSTHTGGINRFDPDTEVFTHYWHRSDDPSSISADWVWVTIEDSQNNLWSGTTAGLDLMDREKGTFTHFRHEVGNEQSLTKGHVLSILEDSKGRFWVGTEFGLSLFDRSNGTAKRITKKDGLYSENIRSIVEDELGQLWLGTASGVTSYDPETTVIKNYYRHGGKLVGFMFYNAATRSRAGEIIMGGASGLRIYRPKSLVANSRIPPIALTKFKIFSDTILPGGRDGLLQQDINSTSEIVLDHTKSMFIFEFAALNFRDIEKNRYAYKLEGFDKNWNYLDAERSAKYTNLDAGHYTFRVKGTNNDGVWNEAGKAIEVVQLPAPWLTWWAYTLYFLAVLLSVFVVIQNQRRKRVFAERQNRLLEEKVAERTAELRKKNQDIQAMLGNMRQGLFTIEPELTIHPEYSQHLETIFETKDIARRSAMDLLFSPAKIGSNKMAEMVDAINCMLGELAVNFEFNSHLLLKEFDVDLPSQNKHLSLDWNPIIANGIIEKIMVTVRDITVVREMEAEAQRQQRELDIIGQLVHIPPKKITRFEQTANNLIEESLTLLNTYDHDRATLIDPLFRNMHTIKGNCRTLHFEQLGELVHSLESELSELRNNKVAPINIDALIQSVTKVKQGIDEYAKIFHEVLGRENEKQLCDGYWLDYESMGILQKCVAHAYLQEPLAQEPQNAKKLIDELTSCTLEVCLEDIVESLPSIAQALGKESPIVQFSECGYRIDSRAQALVSNVFSHILRNSVDHGLEKPEKRQEAGKPTRGAILIHTQIRDGQFLINVSDDGAGLNLEALFERGCEQGVWSESDKPANPEIASAVFSSGVSTKEVVSDISGRGVGLDAVKQFLLEAGGDVAISLVDSQSDKPLCAMPFKFTITLPERFVVSGSDASAKRSLAS